MERHLHNKIFGSTNCLSQEQLLKYNSNALSQKEKHRVEKHLVECELCSDALEGFSDVSSADILNEIRIRVQRITSQQKVVSINYWKRFLVAAILSGIAFVPFYFIFFQNKKSESILAENKMNEIEKSAEIPEEKNTSSENNQVAAEVSSGKDDEGERENLIDTRVADGSGSVKKEVKKVSQIAADELAEAKPDGNKISDESIISETTAMVSDIGTIQEQKEIGSGEEMKKERKEEEKPIVTTEKISQIVAKETAQGYMQPAAQSVAREEQDVSKNYEMEAKKKSEESGFAEKKAPAKALTISTDENFLNEGIALFNEKNYSAALEKFNAILKTNSENSDALYYIGLCYYNFGKYAEAKKIFREISESKSSYKKQAKKKLEELNDK